MKSLITILAILAFTLTSLATAGGITRENLDGFEKLTEAQKAQIVATIADTQTKNERAKEDAVKREAQQLEKAKESSAEKVDKWVTVGTNLGKSLAGAAKETNIAVNEFARTPVGILTTALIVWHFMGGALIHVFGGLLVLSVGFFTIRGMANRCRTRNETTLDKKKVVTLGPLSTEARVGITIAYVVVLILSLITIFTY